MQQFQNTKIKLETEKDFHATVQHKLFPELLYRPYNQQVCVLRRQPTLLAFAAERRAAGAIGRHLLPA